MTAASQPGPNMPSVPRGSKPSCWRVDCKVSTSGPDEPLLSTGMLLNSFEVVSFCLKGRHLKCEIRGVFYGSVNFRNARRDVNARQDKDKAKAAALILRRLERCQ